MRADRFGDGKPDGQPRIERGERVLEHILHAAPQPGLAPAIELRDVLGIQADLAGLRLLEPNDAAPGGGLATTGLAHQRQRLAMPHGQADLLDRMDAPDQTEPAPHIEMRCEVA